MSPGMALLARTKAYLEPHHLGFYGIMIHKGALTGKSGKKQSLKHALPSSNLHTSALDESSARRPANHRSKLSKPSKQWNPHPPGTGARSWNSPGLVHRDPNKTVPLMLPSYLETRAFEQS